MDTQSVPSEPQLDARAFALSNRNIAEASGQVEATTSAEDKNIFQDPRTSSSAHQESGGGGAIDDATADDIDDDIDDDNNHCDEEDFDCYEVLGVSRLANIEDVKRAYKRRALALHPDKGGNASDFSRLCRAYSILTDTPKRQAFDAGGFAAVSMLEDESLRCRLEGHFAKAMQATLAAAGLIFLDAEVLHPRFSVILNPHKHVRRTSKVSRKKKKKKKNDDLMKGKDRCAADDQGSGTSSDLKAATAISSASLHASVDGGTPDVKNVKHNFHLYTASPLRIHASLVKAYPFVKDIWPRPANFSPLVVGNLSLQAHSLLAAVQVDPQTGFINVEIAQRALANSVEGRVEGLGCPICGEVFGQGRPLRMHLMSPRHGLDNWALREAIEASQKRLVYRPLEGVTGRTKKMAEDARKERQRRNEQAAANGGSSGDGWEGTAVGHGNGSGKYRETDQGLLAAREGDLEGIRELVRSGWDPCSSVDALGSCALHWAAGNGHLEICQYLVEEAGVDPLVRCTQGRADGRHALHWAARNGRLAVIAWLVGKHKLGVNDPTFDGTTPFHWAVWRGQIRAAAWLARHGADTRARNRYGCNGSHWAALAGDMAMLRFLDCLWSFTLVLVVNKHSEEGADGVGAEPCSFKNSNSTHPGESQNLADAAENFTGDESIEDQTTSCRGWSLSPQCMSWLQEQEQVQTSDTASQATRDDVAHDCVGGFVYFENGSFEEIVDVNPFCVANTQGHTPLSKAAYAGKRRVCEFFLGKFADENPDHLVAPSKHGRDADSQTEATSGRHISFARLAVPPQDLLLADRNGFRPADIARCAGFERLGDWLEKLSAGLESEPTAKSPPAPSS